MHVMEKGPRRFLGDKGEGTQHLFIQLRGRVDLGGGSGGLMVFTIFFVIGVVLFEFGSIAVSVEDAVETASQAAKARGGNG